MNQCIVDYQYRDYTIVYYFFQYCSPDSMIDYSKRCEQFTPEHTRVNILSDTSRYILVSWKREREPGTQNLLCWVSSLNGKLPRPTRPIFWTPQGSNFPISFGLWALCVILVALRWSAGTVRTGINEPHAKRPRAPLFGYHASSSYYPSTKISRVICHDPVCSSILDYGRA